MLARVIFLFIAVATATTRSQDVFCDAKSWASVLADSSPPDTVKQPKTTYKKPSIQLSGGKVLPPAVYGRLPTDAGLYHVRNVYDGDTLTLTNAKRVRLLGIDTPELAEKQAFAQEAKQYTEELCHNRDVYLTFLSDGKEDKYGRWLALVWIPVASGYFCVNEGLVFEGLATVYLTKKDKRFPNLRKMLVMQRQAREAGRGIWSSFRDFTVVATRHGSAYHKSTCRHLAQSRSLRTLQASDAADEGLHPCRTCLAGR